MISSSIGPYRILEQLGAGGMGEVYLADDTRLGRKVALKRLAGVWLEKPDARERLLHEARAAATLNHPNIAAIYDVIEVDGQPWIVMEYVRGETLAQRLRRGPVPVDEVLPMAFQLADALAEAHARGVIHRDLKPANIRLTADGKVKILDFGLAKTVALKAASQAETAELASVTTQGVLMGTPGYASPEHLLGKAVDGRTDIYSLGVVLFELLTGRLPFVASGAMNLALAALTQPAPAPRDLNSSVPAELSDIVARAMAREPHARFQSISEFRAALHDFTHSASDSPAWLRRVSAIVEPKASRRWWPAAAVAAFLLAAGLAGFRAWPARQAVVDKPEATNAPVIAVLPLVNASGDPSKDYLGIGFAETLTTNLAHVAGVTVVVRRTAPQPQHQSQDLPKVARELGASFLVDGSIQQSGDRVKVAARLVRPDGSVVWGDAYEGSLGAVFTLQTHLAEGVISALQLRLSTAERRRLSTPPTSNIAAFADYAQGRTFLERRDVPGDLDRALELLNAAVVKDPKFALAHAGLGEAYWARYQQTKESSWTSRAREATLEALRLDPDQGGVRYSLAVIYHGTGETDKAIEELRRALALQPNSDDGHRLVGEIFAEQGKLDEAVREFREAIALRPNFFGNYNALGLAFYRAGRYGDAIEALQRVTQLQPDNARGFQQLGSVYHAAGDTSRALENYERANRLSPTRAAYSNIGFLYYSQRKFAEAALAYEQALKLDPNSPVTYRNLGDVYQRLGRGDRARAAYLRAVEITASMLGVNPRDARTLASLAVYEAKLQRRTDARRHAREALGLGSVDPEVLYKNAVVEALTGETSEALAALDLALARGYSAWVAREDEDLEAIKGMPEFKRLLERRPQEP